LGEKRKFRPSTADGRVRALRQAMISRKKRAGMKILLALSIPLTTPA
jgi:hypothetical protein